jgi:hypothetical protein
VASGDTGDHARGPRAGASVTFVAFTGIHFLFVPDGVGIDPKLF